MKNIKNVKSTCTL